MRVMARTETAAREMLQLKVQQNVMTQADATRLFRYAFPTVVATIGNWRRHEYTPEAIEQAIALRAEDARLRLRQARVQNQKNLAARDLVVAQMFSAVWQGMQQDVAAYEDR